MEAFHEDANVDVQWKEGQYPTSGITFLIWRLTGLEENAQYGQWDEDNSRESKANNAKVEIQKPLKSVVTGIPEAVKAFFWPPTQVDEKH